MIIRFPLWEEYFIQNQMPLMPIKQIKLKKNQYPEFFVEINTVWNDSTLKNSRFKIDKFND